MTVGLLTNTKGRLVPLQNTLRRTKQLNIVPTSSGWTSQFAYAVFYADSLNNWRMNFNLLISKDTGTTTGDLTITVPGVTFKNVPTGSQAISCNMAEAGVGYKTPLYYRADDNAGTFSVGCGGAAYNTVVLSGDVALEQEPLTYTTTANLENYGDVTAWFPMADGSTPGLLSTVAQTKSGVMTFSSHSKFNASLEANYAITSGSQTELGSGAQAWTAVTGSTSDFDGVTGRFQPTAAGLYFVGAQIDIASVGAGKYVLLKLLKSGSDTGPNRLASMNVDGAIGTSYGEMLFTTSGVVYLNGSEYVSVWVLHNYGTDRTIYAAETRFFGFRLP